MLWQKESDEGFYVDLLENVNYSLTNLRLHRKKSSTFSVKARAKGSEKYHQKDFAGAMVMFNESICFAESDGDLSVGYANRSSCFFQMHMYHHCLVDIQLAIDANIPENLMSKLEERKRKCDRFLQSSIQPSEAENKIPYMEDTVQISKNEQYGRFVMAKRDLNIGETILEEEAYIHIVYGNEMKECTYCAKENMNFVPCKNCADAMFCSEKCANNNFHNIECDISIHSVDHDGGESSAFLLRSLIVGINTFETINEMMQFVENCRSTDACQISECTASPISKYQSFFKLSLLTSTQQISDYRKKVYIIYHAIMGTKLAVKFQSKATERFLMHLIVHHGLILRSNTFGRLTTEDDDEKNFELKLNILTSYFNHSCIPNTIVLNMNNVTVVKTILPIRQGEQLFINYMCDEEMSEMERNSQLEKIYGFRCNCQLCKKGISSGSEIGCPELRDDLSYQYIEKNLPDLSEHFENTLLRSIKEHCIDFLVKYPNMIETREVNYVLCQLGKILQKELSG